MALTQRLEFRQSQSLVMTPQLMQAIKLLQLSNLDLSAFVEEELERNPLLERASDGTEPPVAGRADAGAGRIFRLATIPARPMATTAVAEHSEMANGSAGDGFEPAQEEWMNRDLGSRTEIEQTLDTGLDNVFSEEPAEAAARTAQDAAPTAYTEWGGGASNDDSYNLEAFVAAEITLGSHLAEQLAVAFAAPAQRMIGQYLIDLVDEAGYLPPDLGQAAERLGASPARRRGGALGAAEIRSARCLRAKPERVPGDPVARTQPLRPCDAGAGRASGSAGQARYRGFAKVLRRR